VHAIPYLVNLADDETPLQWQRGFPTTPGNEAILAIAEIGGKCGVLALKTILEKGNAITRAHAAQSLGNTLDPDALEILYDLLDDSEWMVRDNALYSLATLISNQIYDQSTLEKLIRIAEDINEDIELRTLAVRVIGIFAKEQTAEKDQAVDLLRQFAEDQNTHIRREVALILNDINEPRAIEILIFLVQDEDALVRAYALESLVNLTGQDFGEDVLKWSEWWKSQP